MNKRNLQNEKLDEIGRRLLASAKLRDEEIETIIAAPQLFNCVKAKIKSEQSRQKPENIFFILNWQRITLSFGVSAVLLVTAISLFISINRNLSLPLTANISAPQIQQQKLILEDSPDIDKTIVKNKVMAHSTNFKRESSEIRKSVIKTNFAKRLQHPKNEEEKEFYPLVFTDDPQESKDDAQIIRVELPRSSLIALGVEPPSENMTENVKTELLIGSDGVTRGIRFIK